MTTLFCLPGFRPALLLLLFVKLSSSEDSESDSCLADFLASGSTLTEISGTFPDSSDSLEVEGSYISGGSGLGLVILRSSMLCGFRFFAWSAEVFRIFAFVGLSDETSEDFDLFRGMSFLKGLICVGVGRELAWPGS